MPYKIPEIEDKLDRRCVLLILIGMYCYSIYCYYKYMNWPHMHQCKLSKAP